MNAADAPFFEDRNFQIELLRLTSIHFNEIPNQQLQQLRASQWIFFTSQTAVEQTLLVAVPRTKIAVIGAKSAQKVRKLGFDPTFISSVETEKNMHLLKQNIF
ncbi:uroporphyrinogen-III synthase [Enterococcus sp.]|uniref:uroporphyrinogen-III synthase n=1 Tax=Enterococcus sp. TaxID=35783 RepID=UPI0029133469|nr:uroporphyrinogen-III synthase [Enterococcus sp.]MDU5337273.1 uroporphyrinogen-III synthase [Enterococcus sp.]